LVALFKFESKPNVSAKCAPEWQDMAFPSQNIVSSEDLKIASLTDFISFIQEAPSHASLSICHIVEYQISLETEKIHWNHDHIL
jgi:hypothetical protein